MPLKNRYPDELKNKFLECILEPSFNEILIFKTQSKGNEKNSYQKLKRSPMERHMQTTETYSKYFEGHRRLCQSEESECM